MSTKKFVVACGGTGGHVFPGLAVAQVLRQRGHMVELWLSGRDIEQSALRSWDGNLFVTGMKVFSLRNFYYVIFACLKSFLRLKRLRPDVLLAMGSYSSLPPVLAARLLHIPVVLHEANAVSGKAVAFLSRYTALTAISFKETMAWLPGRKVLYTGLPMRTDLIEQPRFSDIPLDAFTVFVTGGSQGARKINELVSQAMCLLKQEGVDNLYVIHQCGATDEVRIRQRYVSAGVRAKVYAFVEEMGRAYASADFVICRAGAATCFELCLTGKPALLIPLPSAIRNHQHFNAAALVHVGGADEGKQSELTGRSVMRYVLNKMRNPLVLERMREALKTVHVGGAAERVANALESVSHDRR